MQRFMRFYRGYGRVLGWFGVVAGVSAFAIMWLVDANVLGRKLWNQPVMGSVEVSQALLVVCIMLGLPYAQASGAHLRVTLIVAHMPRRMGEVLYGLACLAGCAVIALLTLSGYHFALRAWNVGEEVWGASVRFPLWPVKAMMPLGAGLLSLQFLLDAIRVIVFRAVLARDDIAGEHTVEATAHD
jgi:TRAP-type C4-dicarboxylate transport system permease small subunit